jgi:cell wall-associated NlpC family hydrolase
MFDPSRIPSSGVPGQAPLQPIARGLGYVAPLSDSLAHKLGDTSIQSAQQGAANANVGLVEVRDPRQIAGARLGEAIDQLAAMHKLGPTEAALLHRIAADPAIGEQRLKLITEGIGHLGKPYNWGSTGPKQFDCSGLAGYVYKHALGTTLPRTSYFQNRAGTPVDRGNLKAGDLVFFGKSRTTHVAIYLGDGMMLEAGGEGRVATNAGSVRIRPLRADYRGARRFVDQDPAWLPPKPSVTERVYRSIFDRPVFQRIADTLFG